MSMPITEELLAALKVAHGCLDGHTSLEVWELVEGAIGRAEAMGLGQANHLLPNNVQRMLEAATAEV